MSIITLFAFVLTSLSLIYTGLISLGDPYSKFPQPYLIKVSAAREEAACNMLIFTISRCIQTFHGISPGSHVQGIARSASLNAAASSLGPRASIRCTFGRTVQVQTTPTVTARILFDTFVRFRSTSPRTANHIKS
jgi:hypothetical protein